MKQELKRRSKELRALEKKRGTTRMMRIESSRNQIDYETWRNRTRASPKEMALDEMNNAMPPEELKE